MKLAVIGSRGFNNYTQLCGKLHPLVGSIKTIISGGALGADRLAARFAREHNLPLVEYLPDYAKYGRAAPLKRNLTIIQNCDQVIAFWDGKSRGTFHSINIAKQQGKKVDVVLY